MVDNAQRAEQRSPGIRHCDGIRPCCERGGYRQLHGDTHDASGTRKCLPPVRRQVQEDATRWVDVKVTMSAWVYPNTFATKLLIFIHLCINTTAWKPEFDSRQVPGLFHSTLHTALSRILSNGKAAGAWSSPPNSIWMRVTVPALRLRGAMLD
jgi:hypothetical protein